MKREIKFRAKDYETNEWLYGNLIQRIGHFPSIMFDYEHNGKIRYGERPVKQETVGQFTGLHDKNGKEIYEGDIVSGLVYADFGFGKLGFVNSLVKWNADRCSFELEVEDVLRAYLKSLIIDRLTVIGNVFDNPELLKGGAV